MNDTEKKYRYIYNIEQALKFIKNGATISKEDIRVNPKSGNIFFRFIMDDKLEELIRIWKENKPIKQE